MHPQSQGGIERGNGPFKITTQKRLQDKNTVEWADLIIYEVQAQINRRPSRAKGNFSPYEGFYGKLLQNSPLNVLSDELIRLCKSEGGLNAAYDVVKSGETSDTVIRKTIIDADNKFEHEVSKSVQHEVDSVGSTINVSTTTNSNSSLQLEGEMVTTQQTLDDNSKAVLTSNVPKNEKEVTGYLFG